MNGRPAVVIGRIPVLEALRAGRRPARKLFLLQGAKDLGALRAAAGRAEVEELPRRDLEKLAGSPNHQGAVLWAEPLPLLELKQWVAVARVAPLLLVLDEVEDPQNFGAMVRSAAALGASGVLFGKDRAAPISPASTKAAAGAMEHIDLIQVANIPRALEQLKEAGLWVIGLDATGENMLWEVDLTMPVALIIGSEGRGMRRLVREKCDVVARIPIQGAISSLNASASAAVALAECARQRLQPIT